MLIVNVFIIVNLIAMSFYWRYGQIIINKAYNDKQDEKCDGANPDWHWEEQRRIKLDESNRTGRAVKRKITKLRLASSDTIRQIVITVYVAECLSNFLIGEGKLEQYLEQYPPIEANTHKAKLGLIESKKYLQLAANESGRKVCVKIYFPSNDDIYV